MELLDAQRLIYSTCSASCMISSIEQIADSQRKISEEQFSRLTNEIPVLCHPLAFSFYCGFKSEQGLYDVESLEIIAIITGRGGSQEKLSLLFNIISCGAQKAKIESVKSTVKKILMIYIFHLPRLLKLRNRKMKDYLRILSNSVEIYLREVMLEVNHVNSMVSKEEFLDLFGEKMKNLLDPCFVRQQMAKYQLNEDKYDTDSTEEAIYHYIP